MAKRTMNKKKGMGLPENKLQKFKVTLYVWETNEELAKEMVEGALKSNYSKLPALKNGNYDIDVEWED